MCEQAYTRLKMCSSYVRRQGPQPSGACLLKTAEKGRAVKHGCRPLQSAVDPPADNTKAALSPTAIMHVTHTHPYLRQMRFQLLSSSPFFNLSIIHMLYSQADMGFDSRIMLTEKRVHSLPVSPDTDQAGESPGRHFEVFLGLSCSLHLS